MACQVIELVRCAVVVEVSYLMQVLSFSEAVGYILQPIVFLGEERRLKASTNSLSNDGRILGPPKHLTYPGRQVGITSVLEIRLV
jgi:hypothetical protein